MKDRRLETVRQHLKNAMQILNSIDKDYQHSSNWKSFKEFYDFMLSSEWDKISVWKLRSKCFVNSNKFAKWLILAIEYCATQGLSVTSVKWKLNSRYYIAKSI